MSNTHPALPSLLLLFSRHSHLRALEANFFLPSGDQDVLGDKRKDSVHSHQKLLCWFTLFTVIVSKLPSGRALIFFFFLSQFLSNTQHSPSPTISANLGRSCALEFSGAIYHLHPAPEHGRNPAVNPERKILSIPASKTGRCWTAFLYSNRRVHHPKGAAKPSSIMDIKQKQL